MTENKSPDYSGTAHQPLPPNSDKLSMVEWYSPKQLLNTARDVVVSSLFSHHADRRAFYTEWQNPNLKPIEVGLDKEEVWIDYIADTGDGGNSAYSVAKQVLSDFVQVDDGQIPANKELLDTIGELKKRAPKNNALTLPRGNVLIFGGDLVYPVASEENYQKYFYSHFMAALPKSLQKKLPLSNNDKVSRTVFAFPQNHDWYDSLASFSQIFCHKEKERFLDMHCPQEQSYAAIKLPHDWWVFGLDFALNGDIDELQFEYFLRIIEGKNENGDKAGGLTERSKVIVNYPEPVWTLSALDESTSQKSYRYQDIEKLIEKATGQVIAGKPVRKDINIRLAGDQHYYRRYSTENNASHLITCGSGGAFLHPTHSLKADTLYHNRRLGAAESRRKYEYECPDNSANCLRYETNDKQNYPTPDNSKKLSHKIYQQFIVKNFDFGIVTALTYFLVVWLNFSSLYANFHISCEPNKNRFFDFFDALGYWFWALLLSPTSGLLVLLMIFSLGFFALQSNKHRPISFWVGFGHGIIHFLSIFCIYWMILRHGLFLGESFDPICSKLNVVNFLVVGIAIFISGYLVGSLLMGAYLFISLHCFKLHTNEAFSSLRNEDYKGFLRMRITKDKLEAFFIGIDSVPRKWKRNDDDNQPTWEEDGKPIKPILIDYWTVKNNATTDSST
jgi:hypothetical protein